MQTKVFDSKIELTNDGTLSVFFIGSGSAFSKKYFQTNFLLIKGNDHVLIDCGTTCPFILESAYKTKITDIQNFLPTHPHADHIGGVEEIALVNRYIAKKKPNIILTDEFRKLLWNQSLRGGIQYSEDGQMTLDDYFTQIKPKRIAKKPFDIYEVNIGSINIKLFRSYHVTTKPHSLKKAQYSVGLVVDNSVLFTGDTQFVPDQLEALLKTFDIKTIFHDCDTTNTSAGVHATYNQLKTLSKEIKAKTYLCHYSTEDLNPVQDGFLGFVKSGIYYNL